MPDSPYKKNEFLNNLTQIIEENIANEQFGVSELADRIGMSRSNLLRKIKKQTDLSASQFIRQVRLSNAMEMLKEGSYNVSEVSYKVGFGSTSYFIKCFHDLYGYPPGEVANRISQEPELYQENQDAHIHRLAAIMFTDIEGYTALMQQDEKKAVVFRNRHREVINSITEKYSGKILQYYGDGTLSTFNSAIDAVRCGIELQLAFRKEPQIPVRVGIHSGDIIFTDDGIIGDGVNVASRIETLAVAGSVLISEKIYDEIKNQPEIYTVTLGEFELKNVNKPIEIFALANAGLEVPKRKQIEGKLPVSPSGKNQVESGEKKESGLKWTMVIISAAVLFIAAIIIFTVIKPVAFVQRKPDKSIAVLPFKNESNDSTNVYFINGLMESVLTNLQKIKGLRVISRTSVEKYRNSNKSIPELARELDVTYFVEGSGQKIGNKIQLSIQLIDSHKEKHLWAEQYNRELTDIFSIQKEVAKNIATEIEVYITPEEEQRISKIPTENMEAYDSFLKGLDLINNRVNENPAAAIPYFREAINIDNEFARSYAGIAIAYYLLDYENPVKQYSDSINFYADKALFYDSELPQSLIAKALYCMNTSQYQLAVGYLEKALEYNPNFDIALAYLVEIYVNYLPDTEKYLKYALKGIQLDIASYDSITRSVIYLHLSNAFIQSGFIDEAKKYVYQSLAYDPTNLYAEYVKAYILFAENRDLQLLNKSLLQIFQKDTTRLDVLQEVAKSFYYLRDYENAYRYYHAFDEARNKYNMDIYRSEDLKIAYTCFRHGKKEEADRYYSQFKAYAENDQTVYKQVNLAMYYSAVNEPAKAMEHLQLFSEQEHYHYWTLLFVKQDPVMDAIRENPEFNRIFSEIEAQFQKYHNQIHTSLRKEGLM